MKRTATRLALLIALVLGACAPAQAPTIAPTIPPTAPLSHPTSAALSSNTELIVSAAADLQTAFTEIGAAYEKETGTHVTFNFGSTGQLAQQIAQGAPVDLFAAADRSYVNDLAAHGQVISDTVRLYARGRITLWTREDSPLQLKSLADLARPDIQRVAIANPDHAPYGVAAKEALQRAGVWDIVQPKLIFGENVAQTKQYAETGNVDAAIIALSLSVGTKGHWVLIPQELHNPLDQALAVVKGATNERGARAFIAFVGSPSGRAVMVKYGFVLPGEEGKLPQ
jgi:molybdate transport system substrate-binding protein